MDMVPNEMEKVHGCHKKENKLCTDFENFKNVSLCPISEGNPKVLPLVFESFTRVFFYQDVHFTVVPFFSLAKR